MVRTIMRTTLLLICAFAILAAMSQKYPQAEENGTTAVKIAEKEGIGKYLTDAEGLTLYYFVKDKETTSACIGFCLERWPIFYAETIKAPMGVDMNDFTVINREDGKKQTAYKGRLLYYFFGDTKPGETKGEGVGDSWYVVAP